MTQLFAASKISRTSPMSLSLPGKYACTQQEYLEIVVGVQIKDIN